jgi:hypothetical protein
MDGSDERMRERERKQHGTCTDIPRLEEHGSCGCPLRTQFELFSFHLY